MAHFLVRSSALHRLRWGPSNAGYNSDFHTMRYFLLLAALLSSAPVPAATNSMTASSNLGGAEYPRITPDLRVTVQLKAPNAKQVKLEGGAGLVKEPLEMTRDESGIWSVTTPPAVPGFHYYWFMVDGLRVNDPGSYAFFGWGRDTSGI